MSSATQKISENGSKPEQKAAKLAQQLDTRLKHISETILPSAPYLLQVPTNYRLGEQQANDWRRGSPFDRSEDRLQYMTFLQHHNDETMFRSVGGWDDGKGNFKPTQDKRSGTNSPLPGQPAKKKISLLDYKKKAAGQPMAETPPPKSENEAQPSQKIGQPRSLTDSQESGKPVITEEVSHGVKRRVVQQQSIDAIENSSSADSGAPQGSPPSKKARPSPNVTTAPPKSPIGEKPNVFTLPPLISPIKIKHEKPPVFKLPELLSPTLPADIEEQLAKLQKEKKIVGQKQTNSNGASQAGHKSSPEGSTRLDNSRPVKPSSKASSTALKLSKKEQLKPLPNTQTKKQKTSVGNGIVTSGAKPNVVSVKTGNEGISSVSQSERKRLLVKLKIPKAIRKTCTRILGMTPRPQKHSEQRTVKPVGADISKKEPSPAAKANGINKTQNGRDRLSPLPDRKPTKMDNASPAARSADKKRRLEEGGTPEPASKRHKHPESLDLSARVNTPLRPQLVSPIQSQHGSALKSHLSTPKRDLKSSAIRRIGSMDGDARTPNGAVRGTTPVAMGAPDRMNREGRSISSASLTNLDAAASDRVAALKAEQSKYGALGRTLKHSIPILVPARSDPKEDTQETRQGAALAVEALLAFMLSFVLIDEAKRSSRGSADASAWRSLLGFLPMVKDVTQRYSPLTGLVHQLEGVCRDMISLYDAQRLERDAWLNSMLEESRPSTATSNPALSPSFVEKGKAKTDFGKFRADHVDNLRAAQQAWQIGYSNLSVRDLERLFPDTWAKAADTPGLGKGKDEIVIGKYMEGGFYLPLGPASTEMEAVRVGWRMLEEWCNREGVKWEGKLGL